MLQTWGIITGSITKTWIILHHISRLEHPRKF
jgi:hypothetical protein